MEMLLWCVSFISSIQSHSDLHQNCGVGSSEMGFASAPGSNGHSFSGNADAIGRVVGLTAKYYWFRMFRLSTNPKNRSQSEIQEISHTAEKSGNTFGT
jgi:hypothetical protein